MLTERDIIRELRKQPERYLPLKIEFKQIAGGTQYEPDLKVNLKWRDRKISFLPAIKARTSPKGIVQTLTEVKALPNWREKFLLITPYLSKSIVDILLREQLSGIDLNGNY